MTPFALALFTGDSPPPVAAQAVWLGPGTKLLLEAFARQRSLTPLNWSTSVKAFGGAKGWWKLNRHRFNTTTVLGNRVWRMKYGFNHNATAKELIHPDFLKQMQSGNKKTMILNGATNKQLMEQGYAPIGRDGFEVNLHHSTRGYKSGREPGTLIELPGTTHKRFHGELHRMIGKSAVNRSEFNSYREEYWKWRASNPGI